MHGISDRELVRIAYMKGVQDGRDLLAKELADTLDRDLRDRFRDLENGIPERLMRVSDLEISGPALDALLEKNFAFVWQLTSMTKSEFNARFRPSPDRLDEYERALEKRGFAFKTEG